MTEVGRKRSSMPMLARMVQVTLDGDAIKMDKLTQPFHCEDESILPTRV
jgi:hypothetical protein